MQGKSVGTVQHVFMIGCVSYGAKFGFWDIREPERVLVALGLGLEGWNWWGWC